MNHFFFLFSFFFFLNLAAENHRFEHLFVNEGLPSGEIRAIMQDSRGFLWVGTMNGLYRYDGYAFKNYPVVFSDTRKISSAYIFWILEDQNANLWLGTKGGNGLLYWKRKDETFHQFKHSPDDTTTIGNDRVPTLLLDKNGYLWVGTYGGGLCRSSIPMQDIPEDSIPRQLTFKRYRHDPHNRSGLPSDIITYLYEDSKSRIWIGTDNGLSIMEGQNQGIIRFMNYTHDPDDFGHQQCKNRHTEVTKSQSPAEPTELIYKSRPEFNHSYTIS